MHKLLTSALVATTVVATIAAAPTPTSATVSVDGDVITATVGAVTLDAVTTATDALGDATGSGAGVDLIGSSVSFPEAGAVAIHVAIGDANPGTGHAPVGVQFSVSPTIGTTTIELIATAHPSGMRFASQVCVAGTGANSCTSQAVDGGYADGVLTWVLPNTFAPGDQINVGTAQVDPAITAEVATGTLSGTALDSDQLIGFATVPQASLLLDGEVAGAVALGPDGATVSVAGVEPGTYEAAVQLCGGAADFNGSPSECETIGLGPVTVS